MLSVHCCTTLSIALVVQNWFKVSSYHYCYMAVTFPLPLRVTKIKFLLPTNSPPASEEECLLQSSPVQFTSSLSESQPLSDNQSPSKSQSPSKNQYPSKRQSPSESHNVDSPKSDPSQRHTSSHSHTPPLFSDLPKVRSIKERPYLPRLTDESASSASGSAPSCISGSGVEVPKTFHGVTQIPKISQVSKLLSAFSTWVSLPPSEENSSLQSCDESPLSSGSHVQKDDGDCKLHGDNAEQGEEEEKDSRDAPPQPAGDTAVFLPLVDSVNVRQIQHKLFVSQMRKHLSGVCSNLGLLFHEVLPQVTLTVAKFRSVQLHVQKSLVTYKM